MVKRNVLRGGLIIYVALAMLIISCNENAFDDNPLSTREEKSISKPLADPSTLRTTEKNLPNQTIETTKRKQWWKPEMGMSWQWQLDGEIRLEPAVDVIDVDLFVDDSIIKAAHSQGMKVICYISVGSYEEWRPDVHLFPKNVLGKRYQDWEGERWLDIRQLETLAPIITGRLDLCAKKGFDAVEPDNMDGYLNDTGFPLTFSDQLSFALWLAEEAHNRGLAIGQKNAPELTKDLVNTYDFAIIEDAFYYGWAEEFLPYIDMGKPVFAAEYTDLTSDFSTYCEQARRLGFSMIIKNRELDSWVRRCP